MWTMPGSNFMNGVPELLVLRLLAGSEMYGYELVEAVQEKTGGSIALGEGVIYPTLHALEREGALKSRRKPVNGRTRVYYTVTRKGEKRLAGLVGQWTHIVHAVNLAMGDTRHAAASV
jgi:PadR family transcriptional regulator PadR